MEYSIELVEQQAQPVLSVRKRTSVGNLPMELGKAYCSIMEYLGEIGENPMEAAFAAYYNMDMEDLDVEMGFPVPKEIAGRGEIVSGEIPAGRQVHCMYKGSYTGMEPVYEAMNKWMSEKGYEPTGAAYEFYYNSPQEVPESELLTRIMFPLK